jgi:hypothetical protein
MLCCAVCQHCIRLPYLNVPKGFDWVNEGRLNKEGKKAPKWGFTAFKAGSKISLAVDTEGHLEGGGRKNSSTLVELSLAYLRSYEHMGMARVTCSGKTS